MVLFLDFDNTGVVDGIIGDFGAAEGCEICSGAEFLPDVFSEGADVSAGRNFGANLEIRVSITEDFDVVNCNLAGGWSKICALAGEFVGALTVDLDGAEFGDGLGDVADERLYDGLNLGEIRDFT